MVIGWLLDDFWVVWVVVSLSFESDALTHSLTHSLTYLHSLTCTLSLALSHLYSLTPIQAIKYILWRWNNTLTHSLTYYLHVLDTLLTHTVTHTNNNDQIFNMQKSQRLIFFTTQQRLYFWTIGTLTVKAIYYIMLHDIIKDSDL